MFLAPGTPAKTNPARPQLPNSPKASMDDDDGHAALATEENESNFGFLGLMDLNKSACDDCQIFDGCGNSCLSNIEYMCTSHQLLQWQKAYKVLMIVVIFVHIFM